MLPCRTSETDVVLVVIGAPGTMGVNVIMSISSRIRHSAAGIGLAAALATALVLPSVAQNSEVTQEITGGTGGLTASIADATQPPVAYSNAAQQNPGLLTLSVSDSRGTSAGWNVTVLSSDFDYNGTSPIGSDIPSENFEILTPGDPSVVAGQPVVAAGPLAGVGGTLDAARRVIFAGIGSGSGTYTQNLPVSLDIPALSQTGTYVATLTVAITSGP